jgi:hypothetical protein
MKSVLVIVYIYPSKSYPYPFGVLFSFQGTYYTYSWLYERLTCTSRGFTFFLRLQADGYFIGRHSIPCPVMQGFWKKYCPNAVRRGDFFQNPKGACDLA